MWRRGIPWDTPERRAFGKSIREARDACSMRQEELAGRCEVSPPYISQIEKGLRLPSDIICHKLASVLSELDETELRLRILHLKARTGLLQAFWGRLLTEYVARRVERLPPKARMLLEKLGELSPDRAGDFVAVIIKHIELEEECVRRGMPFDFVPVQVAPPA